MVLSGSLSPPIPGRLLLREGSPQSLFMTYHFEIVINGVDDIDDDIAENLYARCNDALLACRAGVVTLTFDRIADSKVAAVQSAIEDATKPNDTVIDFFVGSGTTLIVCEKLGRICRAVDISPTCCAITVQRWVDLTGKEPKLLP